MLWQDCADVQTFISTSRYLHKSIIKKLFFLFFNKNIYVVGTEKNRLNKTFLEHLKHVQTYGYENHNMCTQKNKNILSPSLITNAIQQGFKSDFWTRK